MSIALPVLQPLEAQKPVNNLYWVPVEKIFFMACSEGRPAQGGQDAFYLVRADSQAQAVLELSKSPGFADNYFKLSPDKRKGQLFRFREGDIVKVAECKMRHVTKREYYVCGAPFEDGVPNENGINGEFGGCCLDGFDVPRGYSFKCPYEDKPIKPQF